MKKKLVVLLMLMSLIAVGQAVLVEDFQSYTESHVSGTFGIVGMENKTVTFIIEVK